MKTFSEFFGIPETDFKIFRSDSLVTVFFENGISFQNFLSELVWCFTDRFLRLPVFCRKLTDFCLGIFWNRVLDFFGNFQHVIFRITCTSLDKYYLFLYFFLDALRFFGIDGVGRQLGLTIWPLERTHSFLCTCYVLVISNRVENGRKKSRLDPYRFLHFTRLFPYLRKKIWKQDGNRRWLIPSVFAGSRFFPD
jgi:hypothetical protein